MGCHFLLQGIFLTQGLNPGLLHCRQTLYHLSHQGSPWTNFRMAEIKRKKEFNLEAWEKETSNTISLKK